MALSGPSRPGPTNRPGPSGFSQWALLGTPPASVGPGFRQDPRQWFPGQAGPGHGRQPSSLADRPAQRNGAAASWPVRPRRLQGRRLEGLKDVLTDDALLAQMAVNQARYLGKLVGSRYSGKTRVSS